MNKSLRIRTLRPRLWPWLLLGAIGLSLLLSNATAEQAFVSDDLRINLRSGPSLKNRIVRMLPAGTALDVMKVDRDQGYSRVKTADGTQGWVLTRHLSSTPSAKDRLADAERAVDTLREEYGSLSAQLEGLRLEHAETSQERERLAADNTRLSRELDTIRRTAARTLKIVEENEGLRENVQELKDELVALQRERDELKDGTARDWFLVGAGVVVLGILIGLILPRIHVRRRSSSSWDTF